MARVTLHRIERGEPSVTMGAYLNAMAALGLMLDVGLVSVGMPGLHDEPAAHVRKPKRIRLGDHTQLQRLAWNVSPDTELTPTEALGLYERNWRHVDPTQMDADEASLLDELARGPGKGRLLV